MTPAHPAREEMHAPPDMPRRTSAHTSAHPPQRAAALELWVMVEMWFAVWLGRWSANPEHWVGVSSCETPCAVAGLDNPLPHAPLPDNPWLFYVAVRDGLAPARRRRLARRVAGALQWMRGRGGRWRVELFAGRARAWTVRNARRRRRWRAKTWVMSDKRGVRANARPATGHPAQVSATSAPPGWGLMRVAPGQARGQEVI